MTYTLRLYGHQGRLLMTVEGIQSMDALLRWVLRLGGSARNCSDLLKKGATVVNGDTLKIEEVQP